MSEQALVSLDEIATATGRRVPDIETEALQLGLSIREDWRDRPALSVAEAKPGSTDGRLMGRRRGVNLCRGCRAALAGPRCPGVPLQVSGRAAVRLVVRRLLWRVGRRFG